MRPVHVAVSFGVVALFATATARAETKVELKGVHICCGQCVRAVAGIVKSVDGASAKCDQKAKTVTITAADDETARKAIAALAKGGFHGTTDNKDLAMKAEEGVPSGKVKSVTVSGIHNCCPACCRDIKAVLKKVDGVTKDTARPRAASFEVSGDFDAAELVKALNEAGFHAKVK
jgi:copper chaperone CopZ